MRLPGDIVFRAECFPQRPDCQSSDRVLTLNFILRETIIMARCGGEPAGQGRAS